MPPTHLSLYWQLPVLREAESKFAKDSATKPEENDVKTDPPDHNVSFCPQLLPQAHKYTVSPAGPGMPLSLQR